MTELNFNNIHKFSFDETKILLDVGSGSVHVIDAVTWDYLDRLNLAQGNWEEALKSLAGKYRETQLTEVMGELKELITGGLLFTPDIDKGAYQPDKNQVVKALCLHIAHDCNLRCLYCFAGTGAFGGDRSLMSPEVGKKALDFLFAASQNRRHIEVDFFGGEPLLNFGVVKELVHYGQEKARQENKILKLTLTTNGVLLTEAVQRFLDEHEISAVLSLDGRQKVNDKMRPFPDGTGSYHIIKDKFLTFVNNRKHQEYYVRGTFTKHNPDFAEDVRHLAELGFKEISVEPVVGDPALDYTFTKEDIPYLKDQYETLTRYYLHYSEKGAGFNFFHFNVDLGQGPCLPKRLSGCGAGHEYLAVSPQGDLYPCHQFVGRKEFKLGTVFAGIKNKQIPEVFQNSHVLHKEACMSCWARYYCSGGCHANNLAWGESLLKPYTLGCELQKKRLECAIYLQVRKAMNS
ncbi:MAG: thioether cross-link-forming SCIFF peptide maturase [Peptococcaceae bacterium]